MCWNLYYEKVDNQNYNTQNAFCILKKYLIRYAYKHININKYNKILINFHAKVHLNPLIRFNNKL